ncbi:hypothetical protein [Mesoterricola sediminis]|uniref:Uncharacterized protein n=1 Tax=Mesoterricola sediminis TaxID=2927980 RepID=A0AA48GY19_9BACT|nr:hypothetical protein [Mesoterricola sediminis]BDU76127.1 hypothetical protein METESE_10850 [Mesoterricola sediminis]
MALARLTLVPAALALLLGTGCLPASAPFHLYPMDPGSNPAPLPAQLRIAFGWQTVAIQVTLPGGDTYQGTVPTDAPPPADRILAGSWDRVFGTGYFNAKVLGSPKYFRATLRNAAGAELLLELHTIPGDVHGGVEGVARDAAGRLYKAGH